MRLIVNKREETYTYIHREGNNIACAYYAATADADEDRQDDDESGNDGS